MSSNRGQRTLDSWIESRPLRPVASTSQARGASSNRHPYPSRRRRDDPYRRGVALAAIAEETLSVLPGIISQLPNLDPYRSEKLEIHQLPPLTAAECPRRTPSGKTIIRISNDDSFNAAIHLADLKGPPSGRVAVLNMASHVSPGGGWLKGARAQEEALCYRSSLYLSLDKRYYPWRQRMGIYTPDVVIIRSDQETGHRLLMPTIQVQNLPVVSVLSIAALRTPPVRDIVLNTPNGPVASKTYAHRADRDLTKLKMRLCLRMAARRNHGLLVLGALGCGAFRNPPEEVARCWLEVLEEPEFQGGWWEEVWFAVYDRRGEGNLEIFEEILGGVEV
ncbi:mitochondrial chaperone BCS1 [Fusarium sp. NRRL 52700]|nr:mitochondrial chaperone BCS1 [Fusarium sp. NRRL 52700]